MNKLWYLSQISMFEALPQEELLKIEEVIPMATIRKNTLIQTPETFREGLYFLKEGKLRLYKSNSNGKQFTQGILGKGNVFGELDSFSLGTKDVFIEAMEDVLLCSMGKEQFEQFLAEHPQLALKLLRVLSERLNEQNAMLEQLALGSIRERILFLLVKLSEQFGVAEGEYHKIDLKLTHQELGNMIGATRESVTVVLNELIKEGVIQTGRLSIRIRKERASRYLNL
ncbi:Crp/Fnr family transcriptional regulator [Desulfitobacterium sp.]|uniref:Crp/Fnr family transcriptional regulator n=1 Tax=Desulfitobacterium sp. TaxID=49981 RepID=UPI002B52AEB9|nr:Crp/Fnr family transcriptional regulator [Desulfitobacterium sp.]HVJ49710.1 Crp/Fnr family transcriptional regulator [Desulfitobacterium sp.]